jgi:cytochrome c-type biogenesis protein
MTLDLAGILVAGLLTFASPCILPLVPVYLGLLAGGSAGDVRSGARPRLLARAVAFSLGLSMVFVALGLVASAAAHLLSAHRPALLGIAGVVVMAFGLRFLGVLRLPFLDRERRPWLQRFAPGASLAGAFGFGGAFALGWTPCIGPVLGAVLTYTASSGASPARGALYLATYSAGLVLPLLAAAAAAPSVLRVLDRVKRRLRWLEVATGLLLVGTGALLATDRLLVLMPSAPRAPRVETASAPPPASAVGEVAACTASGTACSLPDRPWTPSPPGDAAPVRGPAVVEITTRSCPICRRMEPVVAEAERGCATKVTRVLAEDPAGAEMVRRHGVRGVPTFLVLDASGREVKRLVGEQRADDLRRALELATARLCATWPDVGSAPKGS